MDPKPKEEPLWSDHDSYNFNYNCRGLAIVFAMGNFDHLVDTRSSAKIELMMMEKTFEKLGFLVKKYYDLTKAEMTKALERAKDYDHSQCDCFVCVICTHGFEELDEKTCQVQHYIHAKDGEIRTSSIVSLFNECASLQKKPKLFFIQACRQREDINTDSNDYGQNVIYKESNADLKPQTSKPDNGMTDGHTFSEVAAGYIGSLNFKTGLEYEFSSAEYQRLSKKINSTDEQKKCKPDGNTNIMTAKSVKEWKEFKMDPFVLCFKDTLVMFPAKSGKTVWSYVCEGGMLIEALYLTIKRCYPDTRDLLTLLTYVNNHVAIWMNEEKSAPVILHMLTRDVVFSTKI